jgi:hypothetical protein
MIVQFVAAEMKLDARQFRAWLNWQVVYRLLLCEAQSMNQLVNPLLPQKIISLGKHTYVVQIHIKN